jgi:dTDP-4-amino-4,6-dideoxygalactose transaminase
MSEVSAAMALTSLEHEREWVDLNRRHYAAYRADLAGVPGVSLVGYDDRHRSNYQYVVVEIDERAAGISRDRLQRVLWAENVLARRYFFPGCHQMEPYRTGRAPVHLPHTDRLVESVLTLPTGTAVSSSDIATVCALIRLAIARGPELSARLSMPADPAGVER